MKRIAVLVPFAFDETGLAGRRAQQQSVSWGEGIEFEYVPVTAGPQWYENYHDWILSDLAMLECALRIQNDGYDAICIDTMSDSGVNALRSVLKIPVIGPGRASYLTALMLGSRFSVLTQWDGWMHLYRKGIHEAGLDAQCASIRSINIRPDLKNLLGGKEEVVFPLLLEESLRCIEDGADVICLGSTTMHQAHGFLTENLPVPVINPGPLSYAIAQMLLVTGLSQSKTFYHTPEVPKLGMAEAMLAAAQSFAADAG